MRNSGAVWATCVVVALSVTPGLAAAAAPSDSESDGRGISDLIAGPATTLTLEGGLVGMQSLLHFTPLQLRGALCREEKSCTSVDYFALPVGWETEKGAQSVAAAVSARLAQDPDAKVILSGHSQGGQVIYAALRDWSAHPADAPSRDSVVWVSFGNPENPYGRQAGGIGYDNGQGLPIGGTAYDGIEVIRQYDGWADYPQDTTNLVAVANAMMGMMTIHNNYWDVDITDPNNATYTTTTSAGGTITYVWSPTKTLPLVAWAGPLAPALDKMLRPTVEAGYQRPGDVNQKLADANASGIGLSASSDGLLQHIADAVKSASGGSPVSTLASRTSIPAAIPKRGGALRTALAGLLNRRSTGMVGGSSPSGTAKRGQNGTAVTPGAAVTEPGSAGDRRQDPEQRRTFAPAGANSFTALRREARKAVSAVAAGPRQRGHQQRGAGSDTADRR